MATWGATAWALVRAPRSPISSCTVDATYKPQGRGPAATARRNASSTTHSPILSSIATEQARPFRSGWYFSSKVTQSPTRTTLSQSALSVAPISIQRSFIFGTCFRSSSESRWIGFRDMTPGTGPSLPHTLTRAPTSCMGSQPPIGCTEI